MESTNSRVPLASAPSSLTSLKSGTCGIILARKGKAVQLRQGQCLKIIDTHGEQVIDFFAFGLESNLQTPSSSSTITYLSMAHTNAVNLSINPVAGGVLFNNLRKPMFRFMEDTSVGIHDTLFPACDPERYRMLGATGFHDSCAENLHGALTEMRFPWPEYLTPQPLNLFMNVSVDADKKMSFQPFESKGGDFVILRAEENCLVVMSACPQDMRSGMNPTDCHYEIL